MAAPVAVHVTRKFAAKPVQVFDAWLDARLIGRWMFGPALRDEEVVRLEIEPRVGGHFSFVVRRQGVEIDHVGEYLELDRPRRLAFTWGIRANLPDTSRVTIDVAPAPVGSELSLTHELHPAWADFADRTREGWTNMLGALASVLAL
jgi:uncharacterized protein YndB with AHSA1/START domain